MMRAAVLEGEALAVVVQSTRTSPLVADWYEGTLPYLGRLLCFLNFIKLSCVCLRQAGLFWGHRDKLQYNIGLPLPGMHWQRKISTPTAWRSCNDESIDFVALPETAFGQHVYLQFLAQ
jgi:hypothetical protein